MKLENGMFVICPEGDVASYLTNGKKYEVCNVQNDRHGGCSFNIKDDDGDELFCIISETFGCAYLNHKHWIIDNPEKP